MRDIIALDPLRHVVAQPDRFGALNEGAFGARFHQREAATALPEEIGSARSVGEQRAEAIGLRYNVAKRIEGYNISQGKAVSIAIFRSEGTE